MGGEGALFFFIFPGFLLDFFLTLSCDTNKVSIKQAVLDVVSSPGDCKSAPPRADPIDGNPSTTSFLVSAISDVVWRKIRRNGRVSLVKKNTRYNQQRFPYITIHIFFCLIWGIEKKKRPTRSTHSDASDWTRSWHCLFVTRCGISIESSSHATQLDGIISMKVDINQLPLPSSR